ncbi:hypothetical protein [Methylobacterium sp. E-045]|uniref:hypothetical protein n=1 Tax=Methylobacterium sp. E-045 TaxID=2836575 RepID=UPI001FB9D3FD|nr:hypothetical protein [Methylobacterium sp. E-045]MCJ2127354.1 hypothetical protein [Methylobacterium sp. E-045]
MATNTAPVRPSARELREQVVQTVRRTVTFNDGAFTFPASLPDGALISRTLVLIETAFSAGTTLLVGSTVGGNDIVAAADSAATAAGAKRPDTGSLKGRLVGDTVLYGTVTGTPTAGVATIVIEFVPNNDG